MIPAAGRATRLSAASADRPKALVSIAGRPILDWLLERLAGAVADACVIVEDLEGPIPRALGGGAHGIRLRYVRQDEPRGVGDAVLRAWGHVDGAFVVAMGDVFYDRPLGPYVDAWKASGRDGAALVEPVGEASGERMGLVNVQGGEVRAIRKEVPEAGDRRRLAGLAILPAVAFEARDRVAPEEGAELELERIIAWLMAERETSFAAIPYDGWRRNINTDEDLKVVMRQMKRADRA